MSPAARTLRSAKGKLARSARFRWCWRRPAPEESATPFLRDQNAKHGEKQRTAWAPLRANERANTASRRAERPLFRKIPAESAECALKKIGLQENAAAQINLRAHCWTTLSMLRVANYQNQMFRQAFHYFEKFNFLIKPIRAAAATVSRDRVHRLYGLRSPKGDMRHALRVSASTLSSASSFPPRPHKASTAGEKRTLLRPVALAR